MDLDQSKEKRKTDYPFLETLAGKAILSTIQKLCHRVDDDRGNELYVDNFRSYKFLVYTKELGGLRY